MPPYQWTWKWHAVTQWKKEPFAITEEQIDEWVKEKVVETLVKEYVKKDYTISVTSVNTISTITFERKPPTRIMPPRIRYFVDAETTTEFDTDAPVMGSPIDPVTAGVIIAVITLVGIAIKIAFGFYLVHTLQNTMHDIGTGISETFGLPTGAGLGVLFLIILLIIALWVVGKYFWRKRR